MKIIGILGGMGPMATVDLSIKIINNTQAKSDSDHIHIITDNNSQIPDRTSFILGEGEDPLEKMKESAKKLQNMGADFLVMPCNTAHYFYDEITKIIQIPFINMISETAKSIKKEKKIGLMATEGTYKGKVYEKIFEKEKIKLKIPSSRMRKEITKIIYEYKSGKNIADSRLESIVEKLKEEGISTLILGCTELPLIFKGYAGDIKFVDPSEILSKSAIRLAGKKVKTRL